MPDSDSGSKRRSSRRLFLMQSVGFAAGGFVLSACGGTGSSFSCATSKTLTKSQKLARDGRQYSEPSKAAGKSCSNCEFFDAEAEGCGVCKIDALPAHPAGYCNSWVEKKA